MQDTWASIKYIYSSTLKIHQGKSMLQQLCSISVQCGCACRMSGHRVSPALRRPLP